MSLESSIERLADVLEKGLTDLTAAIVRQSEIASSPLVVASPSDVAAKPADIEPPKRGRPRNEPAAPPVASPAAVPPPNGEIKGPSFDEVVAIAQELARLKTPPVAIKLINEHGAQKLADMDPARYPAFYAAAQVALSQPASL
jgi:hypothetical protein